MSIKKDQIIATINEILEKNPGGIPTSALLKEVRDKTGINNKTIGGNFFHLNKRNQLKRKKEGNQWVYFPSSAAPGTVKDRCLSAANQIFAENHGREWQGKDLIEEVARRTNENKVSVRHYLGKLADERKIRKRKEGPRVYYSGVEQTEQLQDPGKNRKEAEYYQSFADYLKKELQECTKAIPCGSERGNPKWGNPDVVGVLRPHRGQVVQFTDEIVSAEVKADSGASSLITAFGQACAYLLFSHRVYLVIPTPKQEDGRRIETLCHNLGIGLVHFDKDAKGIDTSIYTMVLRARSYAPNMRDVNKFLEHEKIKDGLF